MQHRIPPTTAGWCLVAAWLLATAVLRLLDAVAEQRVAVCARLSAVYSSSLISCSLMTTCYRASFATLTALSVLLAAAWACGCLRRLARAVLLERDDSCLRHLSQPLLSKQQQQQLQKQQPGAHHAVCIHMRLQGCSDPSLSTSKQADAAAGAQPAKADATDAAEASRGRGVVDVWVLAGQSNCVGWNQADGQEMPAAAAPWPDRILCWQASGHCWQDARPNVHLGVYDYSDADSCGPDMSFARTLIRSGAAHQVGLVPTACGGTNLFEQWAPGGLLWSNMVDATRAAVGSLGRHGRLAGIIWVQGESDAFTPETAAGYGANFSAWLAATRTALQQHHACVPVAMAVMAVRQRTAAFPFIETVREQQWALKAPGLLKVDMAGFEFYGDGGEEGSGSLVHLTKAGCCALGAAMAYEFVAVEEATQQRQPGQRPKQQQQASLSSLR